MRLFFRAKKRLAQKSWATVRDFTLNCAVASRVGDADTRAPKSTGFLVRRVGVAAEKTSRHFMNYDRFGRDPEQTSQFHHRKREREKERVRTRARIRIRTDSTLIQTARKAPRNVTYACTYKALLAAIRDKRAARKRKHKPADEAPRRWRDSVATPVADTPSTAQKISAGKTHRCYASCGLCQLRSSRAKRLSGGRDVTRVARARSGPRRRD